MILNIKNACYTNLNNLKKVNGHKDPFQAFKTDVLGQEDRKRDRMNERMTEGR